MGRVPQPLGQLKCHDLAASVIGRPDRRTEWWRRKGPCETRRSDPLAHPPSVIGRSCDSSVIHRSRRPRGTDTWPLKRKQWEPFAFASPALVLISLVIVFPLGYSFYLSLLNFDLAVGPDAEFVGLRNYTEALLRDERFLGS